MELEKALSRLRLLIDQIDTLILTLLNARKERFSENTEIEDTMMELLLTRTKAGLLVEQYKRRLGLGIRNRRREREVLLRLYQLAELSEMALTRREIRRYFKALFAMSRNAQYNQRRLAQLMPTARSP